MYFTVAELHMLIRRRQLQKASDCLASVRLHGGDDERAIYDVVLSQAQLAIAQEVVEHANETRTERKRALMEYLA